VKAAEGVSVAAIVGSTDLLLRWVSLRFFDTNTSVNLKCLDFLKALFQLLIAQDSYRMTDYEANGFLPFLVNKVSALPTVTGVDYQRADTRDLFCDEVCL